MKTTRTKRMKTPTSTKMTRKRKMKKKRTTGSSNTPSRVLRASLCIAFALCLLPCLAAKDKPKKQTQASTYAVITGSVFREEGFALPGAELMIAPGSPQGGKKQRAVSDARGEFAVR